MHLTNRELAILGACLYSCEGTKARLVKGRKQKHFAVEFTNKDPQLIKAFLLFLRNSIKAEEDRIKAQLFIYSDLSESDLISYWSHLCNIPICRFNKSIVLIQRNHKYKPNPLGTMKIRYTHKQHYLEIQGIIDELFKQF